MGFNHCNIGQRSCKSLDYGTADIHVSYFPSTKDQGYLGFIAFFKEAAHMFNLKLQVMIIGFRTKFNLLNFYMHLLLACFLKFLTLLILELAIIHNATDWRDRTGRYLNQVKLLLFGKCEGLGCGYNPERLSICSNNSNLCRTNGIVDIHGRLCYDYTPWMGRLNSPSPR